MRGIALSILFAALFLGRQTLAENDRNAIESLAYTTLVMGVICIIFGI